MELLTAIKVFRYSGRKIKPGQSVSVNPIEAKILIGMKVAKYQTKDMQPKVEPEVEPEEIEAKPKRRYVRRDMKADDE